MKNRNRPEISEYANWYADYINQTSGNDFLAALQSADEELYNLLGNLSDERAEKAYAPGKWTIKDLLQHLLDSEWIFAYRALRFARMDSTDLPGFDHDAYVEPARANQRKMTDLLADQRNLRQATTALFSSFSEEALLRNGTANGNYVSVRALAWIIAGHQLHHLKIIKDRYLTVI
jgi:uncharacterized damage-inducible protein DinB